MQLDESNSNLSWGHTNNTCVPPSTELEQVLALPPSVLVKHRSAGCLPNPHLHHEAPIGPNVKNDPGYDQSEMVITVGNLPKFL